MRHDYGLEHFRLLLLFFLPTLMHGMAQVMRRRCGQAQVREEVVLAAAAADVAAAVHCLTVTSDSLLTRSSHSLHPPPAVVPHAWQVHPSDPCLHWTCHSVRLLSVSPLATRCGREDCDFRDDRITSVTRLVIFSVTAGCGRSSVQTGVGDGMSDNSSRQRGRWKGGGRGMRVMCMCVCEERETKQKDETAACNRDCCFCRQKAEGEREHQASSLLCTRSASRMHDAEREPESGDPLSIAIPVWRRNHSRFLTRTTTHLTRERLSSIVSFYLFVCLFVCLK